MAVFCFLCDACCSYVEKTVSPISCFVLFEMIHLKFSEPFTGWHRCLQNTACALHLLFMMCNKNLSETRGAWNFFTSSFYWPEIFSVIFLKLISLHWSPFTRRHDGYSRELEWINCTVQLSFNNAMDSFDFDKSNIGYTFIEI